MTIFQMLIYSCIALNGDCRWDSGRLYAAEAKCNVHGQNMIGFAFSGHDMEYRTIGKYQCVSRSVAE